MNSAESARQSESSNVCNFVDTAGKRSESSDVAGGSGEARGLCDAREQPEAGGTRAADRPSTPNRAETRVTKRRFRTPQLSRYEFETNKSLEEAGGSGEARGACDALEQPEAGGRRAADRPPAPHLVDTSVIRSEGFKPFEYSKLFSSDRLAATGGPHASGQMHSAARETSESVVSPAARDPPPDPDAGAEQRLSREGGVVWRRRCSKRKFETESRITERARGIQRTGRFRSPTASGLDDWMAARVTAQQIREDFTDEQYMELIRIAREATRRNWGNGELTEYEEHGESLRLAMSQRVGSASALPSKRKTFDPLLPDIGNLAAEGLIGEVRVFTRKRYKASSDPNVQTVRRHWFEFCLTVAFISPVRPLPGISQEAAEVEEDIVRCFAAWLARRVIGNTVCGYISMWKRWHKLIVGWDPISSSMLDAKQLATTLAGIRAELPSKRRSRFAHPTRLFAKWWEPLTRQVEGAAIMDYRPFDLATLSVEQRTACTSVLRRIITASGMTFEDLKYTILASVMTAGLLRVSEAIPKVGGEQEPIKVKDVTFFWNKETGELEYVQLMVLPLKKGKGIPKVPIKLPYVKGNVRAAFFIWLLTAIEPASGETNLFRNFSWENRPGQVLSQEEFRKWYHAKLLKADIKHYLHYNTHSFRIAGATALCAAGCSLEQIKTMGRWASDVAEVYERATTGGILNLGRQLDGADTRALEDADDSVFDSAAGVELDEAEQIADAVMAEALDWE